MSYLSFIISIIVVGSGIGVYIFIAQGPAMRAVFGQDRLFEFTYQFFLVTIIGGAITYLYKEIDRHRDKRHELRKMHAELLEAFNRVKSVRRTLRARLGKIDPKSKINAVDYEQHLKMLSDAQLIFEVYAKRAKDSLLWFRGAKSLAISLDKIEGYLNKIISEYEKELSNFSGEPLERELGHLKNLAEFIDPTKEAKEFKKLFKKPMNDALESLGKVMLR